MADEVKFIFKTLIKVPIIILVTYFIFNIFAFTFTYFRLLGLSYVVMQTAVENNFIPPSEAQTLNAYLDSLETGVVDQLAIGCDTDVGNSTDCMNIRNTATNGENSKVQYGTPIKVTVSGRYNWIMPIVDNRKVGSGDRGNANLLTTYDTNGNYDSEGNFVGSSGVPIEDWTPNIVISYTVPGLKYYPDLS